MPAPARGRHDVTEIFIISSIYNGGYGVKSVYCTGGKRLFTAESLQLRPKTAPGAGLFIGPGRLKDQVVPVPGADDLKPRRQTV